MKKIKWTVIVLMVSAMGAGVWLRGELSTPEARIQQLEEQVAREPNNVQRLQQLGWAYFYQARAGHAPALDKAVATFERGVNLAPQDVALARSLGMAYFLKTAVLARAQAGGAEVVAALTRTLAAFDRALARAPEDPLLLSSHGSALSILSGFSRDADVLKKGVAEMNRAVSTHPKNIHARLFRGFTQINLPAGVRDQKAVVEDLNTILNALPAGYNEQAQGVLHVLLGDVYLEAKEPEQAKAHYVAASSLSSAAQEARARLAALPQGQPDTRAIQRYRGNVINCAICHAN